MVDVQIWGTLGGTRSGYAAWPGPVGLYHHHVPYGEISWDFAPSIAGDVRCGWGWIGSGGLAVIGLDWVGLDWAGFGSTRLGRVGLGCIGLTGVAFVWTEYGWVGLDCLG